MGTKFKFNILQRDNVYVNSNFMILKKNKSCVRNVIIAV